MENWGNSINMCLPKNKEGWHGTKHILFFKKIIVSPENQYFKFTKDVLFTHKHVNLEEITIQPNSELNCIDPFLNLILYLLDVSSKIQLSVSVVIFDHFGIIQLFDVSLTFNGSSFASKSSTGQGSMLKKDNNRFDLSFDRSNIW